jgi:Predicted AAA-ATPase/PD-(D/E)XK nuclease superfamily
MLKKNLPIGIQTFSEIIQDGYVYIDKTAYIHTLITTGKCYFLARPRRFGKSLLVSTLSEIFSGNKERFTGLAIESLPYDWKKYPVISISFSDIDCTNPENLNISLKRYLQRIAKQYEINLETVNTPGAMLQDLVQMLADQNPVVLLIDEYDYAILKHIHKPEMVHEMRETVKNFYAVIKGLDKYLKFIFLTGVSKFSKTSIFSGLNNLNDISLDNTYNLLLGYTKDEIIQSFEPYLLEASLYNKYPMEQLLNEITTWYDGYQFSSQTTQKIYNPFSVLLFLEKKQFSNYWFETGTPTFLINLLKVNNYPIQDFDHIKATSSDLSQFEVDTIDLKTLLFQTGYLTIKSYNNDTRNYTLGFPNKECIDSLAEHIIKSMTTLPGSQLNDVVFLLRKAFESNTIEQIFTILTGLFASVPYTIHIGEEKYYQTIFYLVLKMIGAEIIVEESTNIGRIDAVIQTKNHCFIVEFKINDSATHALNQIKTKKYYQKYKSTDKKIVLVGIAFDTTTKNVSDIKWEQLD